jgi:hypothetical protein
MDPGAAGPVRAESAAAVIWADICVRLSTSAICLQLLRERMQPALCTACRTARLVVICTAKARSMLSQILCSALPILPVIGLLGVLSVLLVATGRAGAHPAFRQHPTLWNDTLSKPQAANEKCAAYPASMCNCIFQPHQASPKSTGFGNLRFGAPC